MKGVIGLLIGIIMTNISLRGEDNEDPFQLKDEFAIEQQVYNDDQTQKITQGNNEELKKEYINDEDQFNSGNYIKKDIDQYIVCYTVYFEEDLLQCLDVLGKLHTDKAKKIGEKPIVFKEINFPIKEENEFSIEKYVVCGTTNSFKEFKKCYDALNKFGKPIIFDNVELHIKDDIERYYKDVNNFKVLTWSKSCATYEEYSDLIASGIENIWLGGVDIDSDFISEEEFKKQLYTIIRDKRIMSVYVSGSKPTPIEYVSCLKVRKTPLIDPQNVEDILYFVEVNLTCVKNVTCNTFLCTSLIEKEQNFTCPSMVYAIDEYILFPFIQQEFTMQEFKKIFKDGLKKRSVKTLYLSDYDIDKYNLWEYLQDLNVDKKIFDSNSIGELIEEYYDYVWDNDIMYLSGYVNVKNKPDELSDEEWDQVLILKQKVKEMLEKTINSSKPFVINSKP